MNDKLNIYADDMILLLKVLNYRKICWMHFTLFAHNGRSE